MSIAGLNPSPLYTPIPQKPGFAPLPGLTPPPPPYSPVAPSLHLTPPSPYASLPLTPPPAYQQFAPKPQTPPPSYQAVAPGFTLDQFQRNQTKPIIHLDETAKLSLKTLHPFEFNQLQETATTAPAQEGLYETLYMYDQVNKVLNPLNRSQLKKLLKQGILQNTKAEDGHSALYHVYAMLTTRRAPGYNPREVVNEAVDLLSRPYAITQKFAPLSENGIQKILMVRNYPESNRAGESLMWAMPNGKTGTLALLAK